MNVTETTNLIEAPVVGLPPRDQVERRERLALLKTYERLKRTIKTPFKTTQKILFTIKQPHQTAGVRIAVDVKLFDLFATADDGEFRSSELAEKTQVEEVLLIRWLRMFTGMGLLEERPDNKYKGSTLGLPFSSSSPYANAAVLLGKIHEVLAKVPAYLKDTDYRNPSVNATKDHYFTWLQANPGEQKAFNCTMGIPRLSFGEEQWSDFFPVEQKLLSGTSTDTVILVDMGGGLGHDLREFHDKFHSASGRLILQDLPTVIDDITDQPAGIQLMKHEFFTVQPVHGARAYYLRTVLYDWPDKQARKILEMIRLAMGKDSMLLLYELVVPDAGHSLWVAEMDINLMACLAALERTRKQWVGLLDSAGFELKAVWEPKKNEH